MRPAPLIAAAVVLLTAAVVAWPSADTLSGTTTVRMTVWGMPFEDRLFLDRYARGFEALRPDVRVEYGRFADLKTKYNAWHSLGRGPEIMRIEATWYLEFVRRGLLEPLGPRLADPQRGLPKDWLDNIPPHLRDILQVDGQVYALPQDSAVYGLFYNRDLFDRHNREHPDAPIPYPDETWTWDTLRNAARALTRRDETGRLTQGGFDFAIWAWPFLAFYAQAGGELWSADGSTCLIDSPAGVEALEFLLALRNDGSFNPSLGEYTQGTGADTLFGNGRTAMMLDGSWRVSNLELTYPTLNFAVAPLPRGRRTAVIAGSVLWAISSSARQKDAAWDMLRWLHADEQAAAYWDTLRVAPPANLRVQRSPAFRQTAGVPIDPADLSRGYDVPPMPADRFNDRAAWIVHASTPGPDGVAPAFLPMHEFQADLFNEITTMLRDTLAPDSTVTPRAALRRAADAMHALIDRDRAARGLPPPPRSAR